MVTKTKKVSPVVNYSNSLTQQLKGSRGAFGALRYSFEPIQEEIGNLALWAASNNSEVTFEELRGLPVSIISELYKAVPNNYRLVGNPFLKPAGKQWVAFKKLVSRVKASKTPEDIAAAHDFLQFWEPYALFKISNYEFDKDYVSYEFDSSPKYGTTWNRSTVPHIPLTLLNCYTTWALRTEIERLKLATWGFLGLKETELWENFMFVFTALLHSASTLFTPWVESTRTETEAKKFYGGRTLKQERNVLAPLRELAKHFFEDDPQLFKDLFNEPALPKRGA